MTGTFTRVLLCTFVLVTLAASAAGLTVDAGEDMAVSLGEEVVVEAEFNDTLSDSHEAFFDWGDGIPDSGSVDELNETVTGTHRYENAGYYAVELNVTNDAGEWATDMVNITVAENVPVKIAPRTLNLNGNGNGVFTVFVTLADLCGLNPREASASFAIGEAQPDRINFCMKDGGTFILKFKRNALLEQGTEEGSSIDVSGDVNGTPVAGSGKTHIVTKGQEKNQNKVLEKNAWKINGEEEEKPGKAKGKAKGAAKKNGTDEEPEE